MCIELGRVYPDVDGPGWLKSFKIRLEAEMVYGGTVSASASKSRVPQGHGVRAG